MILAYLGAGALLAGLVMALFSAMLSFWAGWSQNVVMVQVGRRAFYATAAMLVIASVLLETALLTHDFSLAYATEHGLPAQMMQAASDVNDVVLDAVADEAAAASAPESVQVAA